MKIKLINDDIECSNVLYKLTFKNLDNSNIFNKFKEALDYIYNNEIMVVSFELNNNPNYANEFVNILFNYKNNYDYDFGYIYFYTLDHDIYNLYKDLIYKMNNIFERKKDTLAKDVDKIYNKSKSVLIFKDTRFYYNNDELLINNINDSINNIKLYKEDFYLENIDNNTFNNKVLLSEERQLIIAKKYINEGLKTAIINYQSTIHAGSDSMHGEDNLEANLCRISTLYPILHNEYLFNEFYEYNKNNSYHSDRIIYIPNVYIFKNDERYPNVLNRSDWYKINIINISLPNQSLYYINDNELYNIMTNRIEKIFMVAIDNNIEALIINSLGTDLYNNPLVIKNALIEMINKYKKYFKIIHFSMPKNYIEKYNYIIFNDIIKRLD